MHTHARRMRRAMPYAALGLSAVLFAGTAAIALSQPHASPIPASVEPVTAQVPPTAKVPAGPLTESQRAYLLTTQGMTIKVLRDLQQFSPSVASVKCLPLPSTDAGAETTCAVISGGRRLIYTVRVSPELPDTPFVIASVVADPVEHA